LYARASRPGLRAYTREDWPAAEPAESKTIIIRQLDHKPKAEENFPTCPE